MVFFFGFFNVFLQSKRDVSKPVKTQKMETGYNSSSTKPYEPARKGYAPASPTLTPQGNQNYILPTAPKK